MQLVSNLHSLCSKEIPCSKKQSKTSEHSLWLSPASSGNGNFRPIAREQQQEFICFVVSDYFTRYTEVFALPNQEAKIVAHKLVNEFFLRFSLPEQLHSDQGRQFESDIIKEITSMLQIKKQDKSLSPAIR